MVYTLSIDDGLAVIKKQARLKMTYTFKSDMSDRSFSFSSEDAFNTAHDMLREVSKDTIIATCRAHGVELLESTDDPYFKKGVKLVDDWLDIAAEIYAKAFVK